MKHTSLEPRFVEFIPEVLEEGILYISLEYTAALHNCCCGCGHEVSTPFYPPTWWNLLIEEDGTVTLQPSIGCFNLPCKSHYWITKNKVIEA